MKNIRKELVRAFSIKEILLLEEEVNRSYYEPS